MGACILEFCCKISKILLWKLKKELQIAWYPPHDNSHWTVDRSIACEGEGFGGREVERKIENFFIENNK
jgi:hypothetical protein